MLQIKTIRRSGPEDFDKEVNAALLDGWELGKRYLSDVGFVAELERGVITEGEKCCENCKHYTNSAEAEPCVSCNDNASKWEAWDA